MDNEKDPFFTVEELYQKIIQSLRLKVVVKESRYSRKIAKSGKDYGHVQVWGKRETQYLKNLPANKRGEFLKKKLEDDSCCIVLADNLTFLPEIRDEAKRIGVTLFRSGFSRKKCQEKLKKIFASLTSEKKTISGGLLKIFELGVLILGDSGIGKSESALELITRGHRFISDDVVHIKIGPFGKLIGIAPSLSRHIMEIRGLGFINIKKIFGSKSVLSQTKIDLVINLKKWKQGREYDRIGLKFAEDYVILGERIPQINIPVAPGRNIATLIEVACRVHRLRGKGYNASVELTKKLNRALSHN